ncbi:MAG TPA: PepSY-like domain-containing protein, partial [Membranihabitans sp.]|nr:PepSY-like domain-containing protein [Membranihabitans sp.]
MKKSIFFVCTVFLTFPFGVDGQDLLSSQVPATILALFEKEFAKATDVDWEKEGELYKVDFEIKRRIDVEVWYDADGTVVRQEEEWKKSKLPAAVDKSITAEFPDHKIEDVY